jgi:hypothetical protein
MHKPLTSEQMHTWLNTLNGEDTRFVLGYLIGSVPGAVEIALQAHAGERSRQSLEDPWNVPEQGF